MLPLKSRVFVGYEFVEIEVAECIFNRKIRLVSGNDAHEPERYGPKCFAEFDDKIRSSDRPDQKRLLVVQLQSLVIEIAVGYTFITCGIIDKNTRIRIVDDASFDTKTRRL